MSFAPGVILCILGFFMEPSMIHAVNYGLMFILGFSVANLAMTDRSY